MADLKSDLAECVRLHGKATPGPWRLNAHTDTVVSSQSHPVARISEPDHRIRHDGSVGNDGQLIAALHNLFHDHGDELLAAVEDARRYRWLRDNWSRLRTSTGCTARELVVTELFVGGDNPPVAPWSIDDAIDRVVAGNGGGE